jgi:hypothetical protein
MWETSKATPRGQHRRAFNSLAQFPTFRLMDNRENSLPTPPMQLIRLPLAARGESTIGRAPRYCGQDQGARRRRCGDIVDDEQRRDCPQYLGRPKGSGAEGASAALALLDDIPVSPASRRLASAPPALGTRPIVLSPRAARDHRIDRHERLQA